MSARITRFIVLLIVVGIIFYTPVRADSSCSASISNSSVAPNSTTSFSMIVSNLGDSAVSWIKVSVPSGNFTITSQSIGGWTVSQTSSDMTLTGGNLGSSSSSQLGFTVLAGNSEAASANWTVQMSANADGSSAITCTGNLGTAISSTPPDSQAPALDSITVSDVTNSSAKVSWTTDEAATSHIDYGTTDAYGGTADDTSLTTSHSLTISGLSSNTTYHYLLQSNDASGNSGSSSDMTFVTASGSSSSSPTATPTPTVAIRRTPTPAPDTVGPMITVRTSFDSPFVEAPKIEGSVSDPSGVSTVSYSIDNGNNWLPVDELSGSGVKTGTYQFTPIGLEDGNYSVRIKAVDSKGNISLSKTYNLIIDRLPPTVSGAVVTLGTLPIESLPSGVMHMLSGVDEKVTVSAIGGPVSIQLKSADASFVMTKNIDTNLWSGNIRFDIPGKYPVYARAIDGAGNITERLLLTMHVMSSGVITDTEGKPLTDARVVVYTFDSTVKRFTQWDGDAYGQVNPQKTLPDGTYKLWLPVGIYYLEIKSAGYVPSKSKIFALKHNSPILTSIHMQKSLQAIFGPLKFTLPDFRDRSIQLNSFDMTDIPVDQSRIVGTEMPYFSQLVDGKVVSSLSLRGMPTILTILSSWIPQSAAQIAVSNELQNEVGIHSVVMLSGESLNATLIYKKRGLYNVPMFADPTMAITSVLNIQTMPAHILIDKKGKILKIRYGFLTKDELLNDILK